MRDLYSTLGACLLVTACSESPVPTDENAPARGEIRAAWVSTHPTLNSVQVDVFRGDARVDSRTLGDGDFSNSDGDMSGGEATFSLPPGDYRVEASARDETGAVADGCATASTPATVRAGQRTAVMLSIVCSDDGTGDLDVIITVGSNPVITSLAFDPSPFTRTCLPTLVTAGTIDQDGGIPPVSWALSQAPVDGRADLDPNGATLRFVAETAGTYELRVTTFDGLGRSSAVTFPIHVGLGEEGPCLRRPRNTDIRFTEITFRVPEFAGTLLDDDELVILVTDAAGEVTEAAEEAVRDIIGTDRDLPETVSFREVQFDFATLMAARVQARTVLPLSGVNSLSIDERNNRVKISVTDTVAQRRVNAELRAQGIPGELVQFEIGEPYQFFENQGEFRPVIGGVQISNGDGVCTLGHIGVRAGQRGFVTNSHCTSVQGGVEGTLFYQPSSEEDAPPVAIEMVDPVYFTGGSCPSGQRCRLSDSAWVALDDDVTSERGRVFKPGNSRYRVVKEYLFPLDGDFVFKVGRTTGQSTGRVTETCSDIPLDGTDITLLCQARVLAPIAGGDSGSPVLMRLSGDPTDNDVASMGVAWGGTEASFLFSPTQNLESPGELGNINVKAGDDTPTVAITSPLSGRTVPFGAFSVVNLAATTDDLEEGRDCCTVTWTSNVDGPLGSGLNLQTTLPTPGPRTLTATVTDRAGNTSSDSVTVVTENLIPAVTVSRPSAGDSLFRDLPYTLQAWAFDREIFSNLPCDNLEWTSSNPADPFPVSGCTPVATFPATGSRTLTVRARDALGGIGSEAVTFSVVSADPGAPPIVSILQPVGGTGLFKGDAATLVGTAQDTDNGSAILRYTWRGSWRMGEFVIGTDTRPSGSPSNITWTPQDDIVVNCSSEAVTISLEVTDSDGTTVESVAVSVFDPPC